MVVVILMVSVVSIEANDPLNPLAISLDVRIQSCPVINIILDFYVCSFTGDYI